MVSSNLSNNNLNNSNRIINKNRSSYIYFIIYACVIILLGICFWYVYKYFFPNYKKNKVVLLSQKTIIDNDFEMTVKNSDIVLPDINKDDDLGITFGFKIYLENAMENENWGRRFDQLKPIINYSPGVYYHPLENYFEFNVEIRDNVQMTSYQSIKYDNPPLQKWLSIIVVFSSTKILVYVNQELVINKKLKNPPIFKPSSLSIGQLNNNIKGKLSSVIYWGYPLDISEIKKASYDLEY